MLIGSCFDRDATEVAIWSIIRAWHRSAPERFGSDPHKPLKAERAGARHTPSRGPAQKAMTLGRGNASVHGGAMAHAALRHGGQASCGLHPDASGLAASSAWPSASNGGTNVRLTKIRSVSPSTVPRCTISTVEAGMQSVTRVAASLRCPFAVAFVELRHPPPPLQCRLLSMRIGNEISFEARLTVLARGVYLP